MNNIKDKWRYVHIPNLPQNPVKLAVIDGRAKNVGKALEGMGIKVIYTRRHPNLYNAVSYHPDMIMHHLGDKDIIVAPDVCEDFIDELRHYGFNIIIGNTPIFRNYPQNIAYNVARIGNLALHNSNYTDPVLKKELEKRGVKLVNVKQGYAKCMISILDDRHIITSDKGIAKAVVSNGIDCLLVNPGGISLYELDYGFIGGSTGLLSNDKLGVAGNIFLYKEFKKVLDYVWRNKITIKNLVDDEIIDIGSIIPLMESI